jgi:3-isopropylmalate/(R)-2-methylmalate dehydratase small subunit
MKKRGSVYKLRNIFDDVSCDYIISAKYKFKSENKSYLAKHLFEGIEPEFLDNYSLGDMLVAGYNFGCGSTREQAPQSLKVAGVKVVIAKSFGVSFYKNAFNSGLLLVICNTDHIEDRDDVEIDLLNNYVRNLTKRTGIKMDPIPSPLLKLYTDGGLTQHLRKNNNSYNL